MAECSYMKADRFLTALLIATTAGILSVVSSYAQGAPDASATKPTSQQDQALAAMQNALAQQQASLDSFKQSIQANSLAQQRQSVLMQVQREQPVVASVNTKPAALNQTPPAEIAKAPDFFTLAWPATVPLSMPNVQVMDDSCESLPQEDIDKLIGTASKSQGVDAALLKSVMRTESAFKPCAISVAGAMGLMQIMPDTAQLLGLDDPFDPQKNVNAGAKFLKSMLQRYGGDLAMALGAYNAGPATVDKAGGIPPIAETIQYVNSVLGGLAFVY